MSLIAPDVSSRLKPDLLPVIATIYRDMCNLQPGTRVLVLCDARTPASTIAAFHGVALQMGADAATMECSIPAGGPTYQPSARWSPMVAAAACEAGLIVDLAVGYAQFIASALDRGARVIMPGDGIGGPYLDDMLIRTIRDTDIHAVRRMADRVAERFTQAAHCTLLSGDGDRLEIDLDGLEGMPADGFLWDPDRNEWKTNYGILPPAQPGVALPRGRATGTVSVDGTILWHPIYHERPREPLRLCFDAGRLVTIEGDPYLANRIRDWLDRLDDPGAREGPNHLNIGINPNALLTQNQEWERLYGSVTCGMGDLTLASTLIVHGRAAQWSQSKVHWDWTIMQPTVLLDDEPVLSRGHVLV